MLPFSGYQSGRNCKEQEYERKTAPAEPVSYEGIGPLQAQLASEIGHIHSLVQHIRICKQALILLPGEDIGQ